MDDASLVEEVDALENTVYTDTVTKMGEMIMIDVVEICTILLRNDMQRRDSRQEEDSGMGGAIESLEYHECDKIKLDLTETIATEEQTVDESPDIQSRSTQIITQSATIPAAVARYVHVPTNTNNLLNLINQI